MNLGRSTPCGRIGVGVGSTHEVRRVVTVLMLSVMVMVSSLSGLRPVEKGRKVRARSKQ